jgi:hypothetical protein
MKSYHFDVGNSTSGKIGMCLRVNGETTEQAVGFASEFLLDRGHEFQIEGPGAVDEKTAGVEYCTVYLNPVGLTAADIDEENDAEDGDAADKLREKQSMPVVTARIISDDKVCETAFHTNRWLGQASEDEIRDLAHSGWGGSLPADQVAQFMESRDFQVEQVLDHSRKLKTGFEVYVDEIATRRWLAVHRPDLLINL